MVWFDGSDLAHVLIEHVQGEPEKIASEKRFACPVFDDGRIMIHRVHAQCASNEFMLLNKKHSLF